MKKMLAITTAALMGASVLAAPAFAQEANSGDLSGGQHNAAGAGSGMDSTTGASDAAGSETMSEPGIDAGTTAAIDGGFDDALSAVGNNVANAQSISGMSEIDQVDVVQVSEIEGSDSAQVEQAVSQNGDGVDALRSSIEANEELRRALEAQGVDVSTVIGVDMGTTGGITVYVM